MVKGYFKPFNFFYATLSDKETVELTGKKHVAGSLRKTKTAVLILLADSFPYGFFHFAFNVTLTDKWLATGLKKNKTVSKITAIPYSSVTFLHLDPQLFLINMYRLGILQV